MQIIPLQAVPSQTINTTLSGQSCTLNIYQKGIPGVAAPLLTESGFVLLTEGGQELFASPPTYVLDQALYLDLTLNGALLLSGVLCRNATAIVRNTYFGFVGDLAFYDTQGSTDPVFTGLGNGGRYILAYLSPGDIPNTTIQTLAA
jgi:hypothetical protein